MHNSFCKKSRRLAYQLKQLNQAILEAPEQADQAPGLRLSDDSRRRIEQAIKQNLDESR